MAKAEIIKENPAVVEVKREERSLGDLFSELATETSTLFRQELTLARTELTQKATAAGTNVGFMAAGGVIAHAGFLAIIAAVVFGLAYFIPLWLSALIVGLVVAVVGGAIAWWGLNRLKNMDYVPQKTVKTLEEDAKWLKDQVS